MNAFNPELQRKDTESVIKNKLIGLLFKFTGFKFVRTLFLEFKKVGNDDDTKYAAFYLSSNTEIITNESDIDDIFESIYVAIISNIRKVLGKNPSWIIHSVIDHTINISKYNPLAVRNYIKLLKKLDRPKRRFN